MIDPKTAKTTILSGIAELASADGFTAKAKDQAFYLPRPFGRCILHVGFIPHGKTDLDVTADIAVRVDAVERLVNETRSDLSPGEAEETATLGGDVGNIREGRQKRWTITSADQLPTLIPAIYTEARAVALPFFEKHSSMRSVLAVLSSSNPRDWQLAPGHLARCRRAIALAFLIGSADDVGTVMTASEALIAAKDQSALPELGEFAARLRAKHIQGQLPDLN